MITTRTDAALANLDAAQEAFVPHATELRHAREAFKRSRSKKNWARFEAAEHAFSAALQVCDDAHEALMDARDADAAETAERERAERAAAEPTFL